MGKKAFPGKNCRQESLFVLVRFLPARFPLILRPLGLPLGNLENLKIYHLFHVFTKEFFFSRLSFP